MTNKSSNNSLSSWGKYPNFPQKGTFLEWSSDLKRVWKKIYQENGQTLAYGNGRSYGDSCLAVNDHVICTNKLNRFKSVDWVSGRIIAEAGVTLQDILSVSIPQGWFLAVTPGTQFVTLGGAVANDVHGKNHHRRGTFGNSIVQFCLDRSDYGSVVCSKENNPELFTATIGGLGLTGIITWVEIQLVPINSNKIVSSTTRFNSLSEFFILSNELDKKHEYSVAWIDCLATGTQTGRGVFIVGDHAEYGDLEILEKGKLSVPLVSPVSLINSISLKLFNEAYWRTSPREANVKAVYYDPFFYPLDGINNWNRIYGKPGFQQYQCVIPEKNAEPAMRELLVEIAESGQGSFLAVMKRCGDIVSPGLLSFPMPGISLALDFPMNASLENQLFKTLDHIVSIAGGRIYPAKDAHMKALYFQSSYPDWEKLEILRDPTLNSRFWKRVTL